MEKVTFDNITNRQFALFMFITLSQQAEGWAYFLKDNLKMESKMILNRYLNGARSLNNHIKDLYDMDELSEHSAVWGDLLKLMFELPLEKKQLLYAGMVEFINGNIQISDEPTQAITHPLPG